MPENLPGLPHTATTKTAEAISPLAWGDDLGPGPPQVSALIPNEHSALTLGSRWLLRPPAFRFYRDGTEFT